VGGRENRLADESSSTSAHKIQWERTTKEFDLDDYEEIEDAAHRIVRTGVDGGIVGLITALCACEVAEKPLADAQEELSAAVETRAGPDASKTQILITKTIASLPLFAASAAVRLGTLALAGMATAVGFVGGLTAGTVRAILPSAENTRE
jgi:hypothetical protein